MEFVLTRRRKGNFSAALRLRVCLNQGQVPPRTISFGTTLGELEKALLAQTWPGGLYCPGYIAQEEMTLRTDARRYEAGSFNILGIAGLNAALGLLLEVGIDAIAADLTTKRAWLVDALRAKDFEILFPEAQTGITSCSREGTEMKALGEILAAENIVASVRTERSGRDYLRFSPHFYNTTAELERAVALL